MTTAGEETDEGREGDAVSVSDIGSDVWKEPKSNGDSDVSVTGRVSCADMAKRFRLSSWLTMGGGDRDARELTVDPKDCEYVCSGEAPVVASIVEYCGSWRLDESVVASPK